MKFRATQKAIRAGFPYVVKVGYCGLQTMLNYRSPIAYTTRREGWGCDIYDVGGGVAVATGYAPFGNVKMDYERRQDYERRAEQIMYTGNYDSRREALDALIDEFINEVRGK